MNPHGMPFFKFDATEYLTGKIQFCDMETQGVFTNLCARLWSENLVLKNDRFLAKKINVTPSTLERCLTDLMDLEIISEKDGFLSIKFLETQVKERLEFLAKCAKGGKNSRSPNKGTPSKKKEERRKNIKKEKNNKKEISFPISETLSKCKLPEDVKTRFMDWLEVYDAKHGKMTQPAQDTQLRRLIALPADRRMIELDNAIGGQWKNITDTRTGDNMSDAPEPEETEADREDVKRKRAEDYKNRYGQYPTWWSPDAK